MVASGSLPVPDNDLDEVTEECKEARDATEKVQPPEALEMKSVGFKLRVF